MAKLLRGKTSIKGLEQDLNDRVLIADIKDNLISTDVAKPLSANQGKALKDAADAEASARAAADTAIIGGASATHDTLGKIETKLGEEIARAVAAEGVNADAVVTEAGLRASADSALSGRLDNVEAGLVAGIIPKASVADLAALDALVEANVEAGWGYYVTAENDLYVCVGETGGAATGVGTVPLKWASSLATKVTSPPGPSSAIDSVKFMLITSKCLLAD